VYSSTPYLKTQLDLSGLLEYDHIHRWVSPVPKGIQRTPIHGNFISLRTLIGRVFPPKKPPKPRAKKIYSSVNNTGPPIVLLSKPSTIKFIAICSAERRVRGPSGKPIILLGPFSIIFGIANRGLFFDRSRKN